MENDIEEKRVNPQRQHILKILGWIVLTPAVIVVLAIITVLLIPDEKYKEWLSAGVQSSTGRELRIQGEFDLRIGSTLGLTATDIHFASADWSSEEDLFSSQRLHTEVALWPLFTGVLDINLLLEQPRIFLEKRDDGLGNWSFAEPGGVNHVAGNGSKSNALPIKPLIRNLQIDDLQFTLLDDESASRTQANLKKLQIGIVNELLAVEISGRINDIPLGLVGHLGRYEDLLANLSANIKLDGNIGNSTVHVGGMIGPFLPAFTSNLEVSLLANSAKDFSPFFGQSLPDLQGLDIRFDLESSDGRYGINNFRFILDDDALGIRAVGSVADLAGLSGIDLEAEIQSDQPTLLAKKLNRPDTREMTGKIELVVKAHGDLQQLAIDHLRARVQTETIDLRLNGNAENAITGSGVNLEMRAEIASIDELAQLAGMDAVELGRLDLYGKMTSDGEALKLDALTIELTEGVVNGQIHASAADLLPLVGSIGPDINLPDVNLQEARIKINLSAIIPSLAAVSSITGTDIPDLGKLDIQGQITSQGNTLQVDQLDLVLSGDSVNAKLQASAADLLILAGLNDSLDVLGRAGIRIELDADTASLVQLAEHAQITLPELGHLAVRGQITSKDETLALESLDINLDGNVLTASANGAVDNLLSLVDAVRSAEPLDAVGIAVELQATIPSLSTLSEIAGEELPETERIEVAGHLSSQNGTLQLASLDITTASEVLTADLRVSIKDLLALLEINNNPAALGVSGLNAELTAKVPSIAKLAERSRVELPAVGSLELRGKVIGIEDRLSLESLTADLAGKGISAQIDAATRDLLTLKGVNATVDARLDSLSLLSSDNGRPLPVTGPWKSKANISAEEGVEGPTRITAFIEGEGMQGQFTANIPKLNELHTMDVIMSVEAPSIATVGFLAGLELADTRPVQFSGELNAVDGDYRSRDLLIRLGNGSIGANVDFLSAGNDTDAKPSLHGRLDVRDLDLTPLIPQEEPEALSEAEIAEMSKADKEVEIDTSGNAREKLFSREPLPLDWLHDYDIDLQFNVQNLKANKLQIARSNGSLTLHNGLLDFGRVVSVGPEKGRSSIRFSLDAAQPVPALDIEIDIEDSIVFSGGNLDAEIDLDSQGESVAALMAGLDGLIVLAINDVPLKDSFITQFGSGFLHQMNPFRNQEDETRLECAVARFDINQGQVDFVDKIVAKLTDVTWFAGGEINLATEELEITAYPEARRTISGLTNLGLAQLVYVTGPLAQPRVKLNPTDVAKKSVGWATAIATGGWSFLAQRLFAGVKANADKCAKLLEGTAIE